MCVDKLDQIKNTGAQGTVFTASTSGQQILPRNSKRRALVLSSNATIDLFFGFSVNVGGTYTIYLAAKANPLVIDFATFGTVMQDSVWVVGASGTPSVRVLEITEG